MIRPPKILRRVWQSLRFNVLLIFLAASLKRSKLGAVRSSTVEITFRPNSMVGPRQLGLAIVISILQEIREQRKLRSTLLASLCPKNGHPG